MEVPTSRPVRPVTSGHHNPGRTYSSMSGSVASKLSTAEHNLSSYHHHRLRDMPGPAVVGIYVAASIGVAAASYTFYKFVYTPHIAPKFELWREEMKARRQARRGMRSRRLHSPHSSHEDHTMNERRGSDDGGSLVELESLGSVSRSSTLRSAGTQLRQRRPFGQDSSKTQMLDESVTELSYAPLLPTPAQPFNLPSKVSRQGSTDSNSSRNFIVGIETASPSPRRDPLPLVDAPTISHRIQLPTPPSDSPATSTLSLSPSQPHLQAPSLDNSYSHSSALSFNTARSALSPSLTEFHSLSPSNPGSPFTDAMSFSSLSGDEGLFSDRDDTRSRSNDSLVRIDPHHDEQSTVAESEHDQHSAAFIDVDYGSDEGSDDGSDGSWQDVSERRSPGASSPRLL